MILCGESIIARRLISPAFERSASCGMTFGVGPAGYDVRIDKTVILRPGDFALAATLERFDMDDDVLGVVHDKSTWARRGLALQNTVIEPGWRGFLTIELSNHGESTLSIEAGCPIAQIIFHVLDHPTSRPYAGRYQDQPPGAQPAKLLADDDGVLISYN